MFPVVFTSNEFLPSSISNLEMWLDATQIQGLNDGDSVSKWFDRVSGFESVSQSTSAARPVYKTNIQNGKPVVRFDGASSWLDVSYPFDSKQQANSNGCCWSPDGTYFVTTASASPYIYIYKRAGDTFKKLDNPSTLPTGVAYKCQFSGDGNYLIVGHTSSPYITCYKRSGDTFNKIGNPGTLPSGTAWGVAFSNNKYGTNAKDYYVAVGTSTANYVHFYKLDTTNDAWTFLTTDNVGSTAYSLRFNPDDSWVAVGTSTNAGNSYLTMYSRSGDIFTNQGVSQPDSFPTGSVNGVAFSPDGNWLAVATGISPYIIIYYKNGANWQKVTNPASLPPNSGTMVSFSSDSTLIALSHASSPFLAIYQKQGTTNSTTTNWLKLSNPSTLPQANANGVAFHSAGYLGVVNSTQGFLSMYKYTGTTFTALTEMTMLRNKAGATLFAVYKATANSTIQSVINVMRGTTTSGSRATLQAAATNLYNAGGRRLDADAFVAIASTTTTGNWKIHSAIFDYANSDLYQYINNILDGSSTSFQTSGNTSDTDSVVIKIGGENVTTGSFLNGDIAEICIFSRTLDAGEMTKMQTYLSSKWGIT